MKHFDHIVFDVDGTLADTEESVLSSLGQIVQEETGKTLPRHELEFALGIPGKNALEKLGIYSQATLDRWCQVAASFKSTISVFPGLHQVIATLSDNGCKLGIVSSRARDEYAEPNLPEHIASNMVGFANEVRKLFMGDADSYENTIEVTLSTRTLIRWADLTLKFQPLANQGIEPLSYALDRSLAFKATRSTRAMLHELVQRIFAVTF